MIPEQTDNSEQDMQLLDMMNIFLKLIKLESLKKDVITLNNEIIECLTKLSDFKGNAITITDAENMINSFLNGKYDVFDEYFKIKSKKQK